MDSARELAMIHDELLIVRGFTIASVGRHVGLKFFWGAASMFGGRHISSTTILL